MQCEDFKKADFNFHIWDIRSSLVSDPIRLGLGLGLAFYLRQQLFSRENSV